MGRKKVAMQVWMEPEQVDGIEAMARREQMPKATLLRRLITVGITPERNMVVQQGRKLMEDVVRTEVSSDRAVEVLRDLIHAVQLLEHELMDERARSEDYLARLSRIKEAVANG